MIEYTARPASDEHYELAEGPYWDAPRERLLWVDILRGLVLEGTVAGDRVQVSREHRFDGMVGAVVVADDGSLLVAGQERLVVIEPDGTRRPGPRIIAEGVAARNNDGATDPFGRFVVGTLSLGREANRECLYRVDKDGSPFAIDTDLNLSNGLAWSSDGRTFYSVDTLAGIVWKREYSDPLGARERFLCPLGHREVHNQVNFQAAISCPSMKLSSSLFRVRQAIASGVRAAISAGKAGSRMASPGDSTRPCALRKSTATALPTGVNW